jgi:hypothetical protein
MVSWWRWRRAIWLLPFAFSGLLGCKATYSGVVRPTPRLSLLSPELENLTDTAIETYLTADVRPVFPSVLAVAKVGLRPDWSYRREDPASALKLEAIRGGEAEGWRALVGASESGGPAPISQVQLVSPMLVSGYPTIKSLRDAAALLHAPLLLVYMQRDSSDEGYNSAAMAYWTIVGLFCVPGNTVGHCSACQAVLIDTRSGFVLATADGESLKEEKVLPGAVPIARDRTREQARAEAIANLQKSFRTTLADLALSRGVSDQ